jgi:acyl carrier protein
MTLEELNKKVMQIIADQLCCSIEEITVDKKINADLGADSLDLAELIMTLEDEFGIEINDTELFDFTDWSSHDKTIGEIQTFIQSKVSHTT